MKTAPAALRVRLDATHLTAILAPRSAKPNPRCKLPVVADTLLCLLLSVSGLEILAGTVIVVTSSSAAPIIIIKLQAVFFRPKAPMFVP